MIKVIESEFSVKEVSVINFHVVNSVNEYLKLNNDALAAIGDAGDVADICGQITEDIIKDKDPAYIFSGGGFGACIENHTLNYLRELFNKCNGEQDLKTQSYLGFEIIVSTNGDGIVLIDNNPLDGSYPYVHHGNYTKSSEGMMAAKKAALFYFMIKIPSMESILAQRVLYKSGIHLEYLSLKKSIEKAGFEVPVEITASDCANKLIMFNGEIF